MAEFDQETHERIEAHCAAGDKLAASRDYEQAIAEYNKAWKLVPEPKHDWDASTWIMAAVADAAYLGGFQTTAREALEYAMACPGAHPPP